VGLPLSVEFARAGLPVTGIEVDHRKVKAIQSGQSYIPDVPEAVLAPLVRARQLQATSNYASLSDADAVIICVPTPLNKTRDPDVSYILDAADEIARHAHRDMLVVLESTTYPGTTEEVILPRLLTDGRQVGRDIFVAFSPERIDPGNKTFNVRNTPKVIGGITPECTSVAAALYRHAVDQVVAVSSARTAAMVKLLENTFRAVNIGLANEMALICDKLGLEVWEVVRAASTKPYGFMPFYPGPGLGGHCLPIDPLYLSWKLRTFNYNARFIELADDVNSNMPRHVVSKISDALNTCRKAVNGSQMLILGVAYKRDVNDVRESPALEIIRLLRERGAAVSYHDPYVARLSEGDFDLVSISLTEQALAEADCVVVVTDHSSYDWTWIAQHTRMILDTRDALRGIDSRQARVVKL
jgi:UDP-N-acetyl-D-glucosamine dehydrogenase